jgi:hypothetical protein
VSVCVQALLSLQVVPLAAVGFEQVPVEVLQVPLVWHWSLAVQVTGFPPVQTPAWQVSVWVQALPSLQVVPFAFLASAGQAADEPVQFSATSQALAATRQTLDEAANPSAGQVSALPLQVSATSQTPADARQLVPLALAEQVPTLPEMPQLPQMSVQAVLQHTLPPPEPPETQWACRHWLLAVQD